MLIEPDGTGVWHELAEAFNRTQRVHVRLLEGPPATDTREDMYSTAFLGGQSGYDIIYSDVIWVPKFAAAGWLLDLTDRLEASDRADFLHADLQAGIYDGKLYRIPAVTDAAMLYYRSDLVRRPPQTFEDLVEEARVHGNRQRWGFLWQGKQFEGLVTNFLEILWGYGGDWITPDRQVLLDSPEALNALQFLKSTIGTISPPGVTTYAEEDTRMLFQSGRAVSLRNWYYVWALARRPESEIKGKVAFTPMVHAPGQKSAATLGGWGFAISKFSRNPDAAWEFVRFVTDPKQLRTLHARTGLIPARMSLVPPEFNEIIRSARARPQIPEYSRASDILQRWLSAALTGAADPADALNAAARETRALLK
jgi:multiple sugar transport system substrate-binding protein